MSKTTEITRVMAPGESLEEISARFKRWRETRVSPSPSATFATRFCIGLVTWIC